MKHPMAGKHAVVAAATFLTGATQAIADFTVTNQLDESISSSATDGFFTEIKIDVPVADFGAGVNVNGNTNNTQYDLRTDGFSFSFLHGLTGGNDDSVGTRGPVIFEVGPQSLSYDLSGSYGVEGEQDIRMVVNLVDVGTGDSLFATNLRSQNTPDEVFILGQLGGDFRNDLSGSTTGTLHAGRTYRLSFNYRIDGQAGAGAGGAEGGLGINFQPATIPAPGAALLATIGLGGMGSMRKRRTAN